MRAFLIIASIHASLATAAIECIDADLILHHGNIYTGNNENSFTGSIATKGSTISYVCLLYTSPSPRDATLSRMPSSA